MLKPWNIGKAKGGDLERVGIIEKRLFKMGLGVMVDSILIVLH